MPATRWLFDCLVMLFFNNGLEGSCAELNQPDLPVFQVQRGV